jgi:hypothetical protein
MHQSHQEKNWYQQKAGKLGKRLPPKYKRMLSSKQIACIEYTEITEDDKCEIFQVRGVSAIRFQLPILPK